MCWPLRAGGQSLASAVCRVLAALVVNLEGKARAYKSPALAAVFLMNNVAYLVSGGVVWSDECRRFRFTRCLPLVSRRGHASP